MAKNRNTPQPQKNEDSFKGKSKKNTITSGRSNFFIKPKKNAGKYFIDRDRQEETSIETINKTPKTSTSNNRSPFLKPETQSRESFINTNERERNKLITEANDDTNKRKPFDKKLYRLKKYSAKYKSQRYQDNRKKDVLKDFHKQTKYSQKFDVNKIYDELDTEDRTTTKNKTPEDKTIPQKAKFRTIKEGQKKEKDALLNKLNNQKKSEKHPKQNVVKSKNMFRKTKRGQPIMKDRMEMLLEKIQKIQ